MFKLDRALEQWRQQMLDAGIKSRDILDELESHLRDDVERETNSGLTTEEAFREAVQNLGKARALKTEFKKQNKGSAMIEKLMIGICGVVVGFIVLLSGITIVLCFGSRQERMIASAAVISILIVALGWRFTLRFLPMIEKTRTRWGMGLACIASGFGASSFFCEFILPRFEVSPDHQLPAIGLWAVFLIAIFTCAGVGLLLSKSERERLTPAKVAEPSRLCSSGPLSNL